MRVYSITSRQEGFNINNIFDESLLNTTEYNLCHELSTWIIWSFDELYL